MNGKRRLSNWGAVVYSVGMLGGACLIHGQLMGQQPDVDSSEPTEFFETKIKPIFAVHCFECHGQGEKIRGEFILTNREDMIAGGESGAAVDLGSPAESLLLSAINYDALEMPPDGKLPQSDIDNIAKWLEMGAPWKGEGFKPKIVAGEKMAPMVNDETKSWWSFQTPVRPEVPEFATETSSLPIDRFVAKRLREAGLAPNPAADRRTLIRRATYDLTGLPPSLEEVKAFVNNDAPDAYEKLLDRLLASKHYGEKWGRHWLDLVRYAESNSYERDGTKPFVWKYRDYVIRALNTDKPYDEFLIQQLAGDEVDATVPDNLIATGYYRLGMWDDEPVDPQQAWFDDMDDILKTTTDSFLGLTVGCARCHDHKIDPIPQADYYRLLACFAGVQRYGIRGRDTVIQQSTRTVAPADQIAQHESESNAYKNSIVDAQAVLRRIERIVKPDFISVEHDEFAHEMNRVPLIEKRVGKTIRGIEFTKEQAANYKNAFLNLKKLRNNPPTQLERVLCVTETGVDVPEMHVLIRGNSQAEGKSVEPGFPAVLSPPSPKIVMPPDKKSTGRRLALARWIASPKNPLTSRVIVNRIWQHHFGRGIVRSSSNFGFQGTAPTHPELLDWLAVEFVEGGWKLKRMHKMIMMSQTYRMSSIEQAKAATVDPLNDWFWRFEVRRLTAEEVRDSVLAANGTLDRDTQFGPSIFPKLAPEVLQGQSRPGENWGKSTESDLCRRSIYIHLKRSLPVPLLAAFDVAETDSSCPIRFNTVQPTQALAMLNSQFINDEASKLALAVNLVHPDNLSEQIKTILSRVTQREPNEQEVRRGVDFVAMLRDEGQDEKKSLQLFCVVTLNLNEFLYLD